MLLFVFLIIERLIRQICLVGAIDKTGPEKYIWQESNSFTTEKLKHRPAFYEPMAFMLKLAFVFPYLISLILW